MYEYGSVRVNVAGRTDSLARSLPYEREFHGHNEVRRKA